MVIKEIYWERTYLILKFEYLNSNKRFYLRNNKNNIELFPKNNKIKILLTNTPEGSILPEGEWKIYCDSENITIDTALIPKLEDYSRIFRYKHNKYAYIVTFSIDKNKVICISTSFMIKNKNPKKIYQLYESKKIKDKFEGLKKTVLYKLANILYNIYYNICPNKKNTLVFLSENDGELKDNALAFYQYMKEKNYYNIKIYCSNVFKKRQGLISILKEILIAASGNYIIIDNYVSLLTHLNVSKNVKIIQLWHAGIGFKSVGYARFGLEGSPHPYVSCHRKYDYVVVDNEELIDIYAEIFGVSKSKFIASGMPRLENYLDKKRIEETVYKLYNNNSILKEKKIILFSPTFRGSGNGSAYYDMQMISQKKLAKFCLENNFVVIFKFHPFTMNKIKIEEEYKDIFFDYTVGYDINDLMYITDILISDYSSCAYEYSFFDRPIIFYRYDKILYEYERKIYTKNLFTDETYEALNFEELIDYLNKLSNKPKFDILKCEISNRISACSIIEKEIFGGK